MLTLLTEIIKLCGTYVKERYARGSSHWVECLQAN